MLVTEEKSHMVMSPDVLRIEDYFKKTGDLDQILLHSGRPGCALRQIWLMAALARIKCSSLNTSSSTTICATTQKAAFELGLPQGRTSALALPQVKPGVIVPPACVCSLVFLPGLQARFQHQ